PTEFGMNEQVFEVKSRPAHPGGVVEEIEGETRRLTVDLGYQAEIEWVGAESITHQIRFCRSNRVWLTFVRGKSANERKNLRNVLRSCRPNRCRHAFIPQPLFPFFIL